MAFAIPNKGGFGNASPTNPLTSSSFSSTTGNMLVCAVRAGASTTISSVKNQAGVSFTALTAQVNGAQRVQFFYLKNITGNASDSISVTFNAGNNNNCAYFWEISGANTITAQDASAGGNAANTNTVTSAAFNTTAVDEIILSAAVGNVSGTWSAGGSYVLDSSNGFGGLIGAQHLITSSLQSGVTASMTSTATSTLLTIAIASFRAATTKGAVQSVAQTGLPGSSTQTIAYPLNNQAGNLLVLVGRIAATSISPGVSDSQGNTWTILQQDAVSSSIHFLVAYAPNCKAGANTISVTTGAGNFTSFSMIAAEFTGVKVSSPVDVFSTLATASSSSTATANSITTTASDLVLLTVANETSGNPGYTPAGGFIQLQPGINGLLAFNVPVAAGAIAPSSGIGTPVTWEAYSSSFFLTGGTTPQTLTAATASLAGVLLKNTSHGIVAATASLAAVLLKKTSKTISAATASFAATLTRALTNAITFAAATASLAATLIKKTEKTLTAATQSLAAQLVKQTGIILTAATASFAATLTKAFNRIFAAATAAFAAVLGKSMAKTLTAAMSSFAATINKAISLILAAATASFSGTITEGFKFNQIFTAAMALFSAILSILLKKNPFVNRGPAIKRFGVSTVFPAVISTATNGLVFFEQPDPTAFTNQDLIQLNLPAAGSGTADDWGGLGQRVMAGKLLVAPGNGRLGGKTYLLAASGDITVPSSASGATINLGSESKRFLCRRSSRIDGQ